MPRGRNTLAVNTFRLRAAARERKSAMKQKNGRIGGLPANINIMNPVPSKREGVALAKQGGIRGVAIASRNGSEYLRSLPDGTASNNLGDLPSSSQE